MPYPDYQPMRPVSAFLGGMEAGQKIAGTALDLQAKRRAAERETARESALKSYAQTGDMNAVIIADPEFGLKLMGQLRQMGAEERKANMDALSKGADFMTKALPFLNAQNYNLFLEDASKIPVLRGLIPPTFDPRWVELAKKGVEDTKTAVARINAESSRYRADVGYAGRELTAGARITAAQIGAASRERVAAGKGRGGAKGPDFQTWREDFLRRFPNATESDVNINWNRERAYGAGLGKPPPASVGRGYSAGRGGVGPPAAAPPPGATMGAPTPTAPGTVPTTTTGYRGPARYYDKLGNEVPIHSQEEYDRLIGK